MSRHKHILILRFSSFGDLAILQPLLKIKMAAHPDIEVSLAGPPRVEPLFTDIPGLNYIPVDKHSGIMNIFRTVRACHPTVVADIHSMLRTYILDLLFLFHFIPVYTCAKEHKERRKLSRLKNKIRAQLTHAWQRYDEVLTKAGLDAPVEVPPFIEPVRRNEKMKKVGIAPFASTYGKSWPIESMEKVVKELSKDENIRLVFFGGNNYKEFFQKWVERYPNSECTCGFSFSAELEVIRTLDVMVSMDSANMHFASCMEIPCVSIWVASHPFYGFYGWRQNPDWALVPALDCQPCSVYGKKECIYGTYACLHAITPEMVVNKIRQIIFPETK